MNSKALLIALFVMVCFLSFAAISKSVRRSPRFLRRQFLSDAEKRVLGYLELALPTHRIMAQVAMGALLKAEENGRKRSYASRNRFAQKIVDFVVVSPDTAEVVALVELDDRTHRAPRMPLAML